MGTTALPSAIAKVATGSRRRDTELLAQWKRAHRTTCGPLYLPYRKYFNRCHNIIKQVSLPPFYGWGDRTSKKLNILIQVTNLVRLQWHQSHCSPWVLNDNLSFILLDVKIKMELVWKPKGWESQKSCWVACLTSVLSIFPDVFGIVMLITTQGQYSPTHFAMRFS